MASADFTRTQNPLPNANFLVDPFLEANNPLSSTPLTKSTKLETKCISEGSLAGAIIGTLILSAFAAFLSWLIYLRPKFQELHEKQAYEDFHNKFSFSSRERAKEQLQRQTKRAYDNRGSDLPLDATDYKFGTFPFRHSQLSQPHYHHGQDWMHRNSSSIRSMNINQNLQMLDIELLDPTFGGLNFNITGSMKSGIFIKDIIDHDKNKDENQLKSGDRVMALTICFESIVYEDALTILSYASPYPVILRIQRVVDPSTVAIIEETRPSAMNHSTNKVKWREEFEHYDNDSRSKYSFIPSILPNNIEHSPPLPLHDKPNLIGHSSSTSKLRSSARRTSSQMNTEPRMNVKTSSSPSTAVLMNKNQKIRSSSSGILATSGAPTMRNNNDRKKYQHRSKSNYSNAMSLDRRSTQKTVMTSVTTTMTTDNIQRKHGHNRKQRQQNQDVDHSPNRFEEPITPFYDSPYDCFDDQIDTQYQYLHQSHLNRNNNNSLSMQSLTIVTPVSDRSISKPNLSVIRRFDRRISSPAVMSSIPPSQTNKDLYEVSLDNTDTFV